MSDDLTPIAVEDFAVDLPVLITVSYSGKVQSLTSDAFKTTVVVEVTEGPYIGEVWDPVEIPLASGYEVDAWPIFEFYRRDPAPDDGDKFDGSDGSKWIYNDTLSLYFCWKTGTTWSVGALATLLTILNSTVTLIPA